ncbi:MAG: hypothetical protein AB8F95_04115 [Bacteroidia bacterium]
MLVLLLTWTYSFLLSFAFGHMLLTFLRSVGLTRNAEPYHPTLIVIGGWMMLTSFASIWYFFAPINGIFQIVLLAIALAHIWQFRQVLLDKIAYYRLEVKRSHWIVKAFFAAAVLLAVLVSVGAPSYYDDGLYYRQFVRWLNEYAIVPGLGNLHPRLAFNSNWHVLQAVFSFHYLPDGGLMDLNGLLHIVVAAYGLEGMRRLFIGDHRLSVVFRSLFLLPTHYFVFFLTAPSADAAVIYGAWIVMVLFLEKTEDNSLFKFDLKSALIFMLSAYVITAKLTAAPLAILPLIVLMHTLRKGERLHYQMLIVAGLFVSLPWLARNVILSGYVFFPFYQIDLLNVDWKVPVAMAQEESSYIRAFAINPLEPYTEVLNQPFSVWFPAWISRLRFFQKILFLLTVAVTPTLIGYVFFHLIKGGRQYLKDNLGYIAVLGTLLAGLAVWFTTAPDPRFGYTFSIGLYLTILVVGIRRLLQSRFSAYVPVGVAIVLALFYLRPLQLGVRTALPAITSQSDAALVIPAPYKDSNGSSQVLTGEFTLRGPVMNDQCWNAPLPCSPFAGSGLKLRIREKGFSAGFILEDPDLLEYRAMQLQYQRPVYNPKEVVYMKTNDN